MERHVVLFRMKAQVEEALGPVNGWYCSQMYGRRIDDPDLLMEYFARHGGAEDFARRFSEAMGSDNRWFCSQFYRRPVGDPKMLWEYYLRNRKVATPGAGFRETTFV